MALKDWKKEGTSDQVTQWFNQKKQLSIFVYKQNYVKNANKKSHWVFEVANSKKTFRETFTRTKSSALRYAKAYMRNN